jgi:DNA-binding NtrC family response regulator
VSVSEEVVGHEVLIVDGDEKVHKGIVQLCAPLGLHVTGVADPGRALELVRQKFFGVVLIDLDTPEPGAGLALVKQVRELSPATNVLVISPRKTFDAAVSAFREGARDVIMKAPDQVDYLKDRIAAAAGTAARRGGAGTLLADTRDFLEELLKACMESDRRAASVEEKASGRDSRMLQAEGEMAILVVDGDDRLFKGMQGAKVPGFGFQLATTAGEALDRVTNARFHLALVGQGLPDMPGDVLVRALKAQAPELIVIAYVPNGKLEIVETTRSITLAESFTQAKQLTDRLEELAEAHRAKARERRYLQAFRERNYELLRRYAELKRRLDKATSEE